MSRRSRLPGWGYSQRISGGALERGMPGMNDIKMSKVLLLCQLLAGMIARQDRGSDSWRPTITFSNHGHASSVTVNAWPRDKQSYDDHASRSLGSDIEEHLPRRCRAHHRR